MQTITLHQGSVGRELARRFTPTLDSPQYQIHYCHAGKNPLRVASVSMLVMAMRIRRLLLADERVNNRKWRDVDVKVWDNIQSRYIVS